MRRPLFAMAVLVVCGGAWAAAQEPRTPARRATSDASPPPPAPPVIVNTAIDRTAVWVGDPVVYTIEITCPPGSDILAADISRDRLKLANLDIVGATQDRQVSPDGTIVYRAQYRLVSFAADGSKVGIEPQPVRYYVHTAGQPPESLVPADELKLPAKTIVVRSSLPDGDVEWIRDRRTAATLPSAVALLTPLGVVAVAMTLVPVVIGLAGVVWARRPRRTRRSKRHAMQMYRDTLEQVRALDTRAKAESRRDAFDRLNALIRDRLTDFGVPARSLSADEVEASMAGTPRLEVAEVAATLRDCERAIYGRSEELPGPDAVAAAVECAERLVTARTR